MQEFVSADKETQQKVIDRAPVKGFSKALERAFAESRPTTPEARRRARNKRRKAAKVR
jgi:hypothetical protein